MSIFCCPTSSSLKKDIGNADSPFNLNGGKHDWNEGSLLAMLPMAKKQKYRVYAQYGHKILYVCSSRQHSRHFFFFGAYEGLADESTASLQALSRNTKWGIAKRGGLQLLLANASFSQRGRPGKTSGSCYCTIKHVESHDTTRSTLHKQYTKERRADNFGDESIPHLPPSSSARTWARSRLMRNIIWHALKNVYLRPV